MTPSSLRSCSTLPSVYQTQIPIGEKRAELISWIGNHVEQENGEPPLCVNLSCAEYHRLDIEKLLNDRRNIMGHPPVSLNNIAEKFRVVNVYYITIQ
jgi:hypothetical protein